MSVLNVKTKDQILFIEKPVPIVTSGNQNNDVIRVTFDETWDCEKGKFFASFYIEKPEDAIPCDLTLEEGNCFRCTIPDAMLKKEGYFHFGVWCDSQDKRKTSDVKMVRVNQGAVTNDDTGESEIDIAVNSAKEEYRSELETSIETATGENYDGKTWEELNNTVAELPVLKEEQTQALGDWDLIKAYFENHTAGGHNLFTRPPKDADEKDMFYKLPYIYTPRTRWNEQSAVFSSYVTEAGVDVSSAIGMSSANGLRRMFSNLPNLERLIITGNAYAPSVYELFQSDSSLKYVKMETANENVLLANSSYYISAFNWCQSLETIDCELDFTNQTAVGKLFALCYKLRHLRIKPFTLSTSLDFSSCQFLHFSGADDYDSLISILNAITLDKEVAKNITLTFSGAITDFTQGMVQYWSKCVYFYGSDGLYHSEPPEVTEDEVYLETYLYDAFMNKGVTIAIL